MFTSRSNEVRDKIITFPVDRPWICTTVHSVHYSYILVKCSNIAGNSRYRRKKCFSYMAVFLSVSCLSELLNGWCCRCEISVVTGNCSSGVENVRINGAIWQQGGMHYTSISMYLSTSSLFMCCVSVL